MKQGEWLQAVQDAEQALSVAANQQLLLMEQFDSLPVGDTAKLVLLKRGKRRWLKWRQRYYSRCYFQLSSDLGNYWLQTFPEQRQTLLEIEQQRILTNYCYQLAAYRCERLEQLKTELTVWRNLKQEITKCV